MNSAICSSCHADRFINPDIELLMSTCFHLICTKCIDRLFSIGRQTACPQCQQIIKKHLFQVQQFEDISIEKDLRIRKRIEGIYNKPESDFMTLMDYNNYIEHKEDIVMNLLANINVNDIEKEVKAYEMENRQDILKNQYKEQAQHQLTKNEIQNASKKRNELHSKYMTDAKRENQEQLLEKEKFLQQVEMGVDIKKARKDYQEKLNQQNVDPLETLVNTQFSFFSEYKSKESPFFIKFKQNWQKLRCVGKDFDKQIEAGGYNPDHVFLRASNELSDLFC